VSALILAVDTTGELGSIALVSEAGVVAEAELGPPGAFADVLFGAIETLLSQAGLTGTGVAVTDISAFASASGPGSFTGVRIGLTAVKGLAEATGRPAIAVSNLQALAFFGKKPLRAVVIDARRGEIYGAVYNAALEPVHEEVVMKLDAWLESLPSGEVEVVTNSHALAEVVRSACHADTGRQVSEAPHALAVAIGKIALDRLQRGLAQDPVEIDANYVRRSDAELLWKDPWATKGPAAR
jgi:tRNA threonylcarbamoyladenosine biosynthesis protein TsaB